MDNFENIPKPNDDRPFWGFTPAPMDLSDEREVPAAAVPPQMELPRTNKILEEDPEPVQEAPAVQIPQPEAAEPVYRAPQPEPVAQAYRAPQPEPVKESYQIPRPEPQRIAWEHTTVSQPEQPVPEKPRKKKKSRGIWKKLVAAVLVLALVAGSCAFTAHMVGRDWQTRAAQMEVDFSVRMAQLQAELDHVSKKADQQITLGALPAGELLTPAQVYALNVDAVVMVYSTVVYNNFGQQTSGTSAGSGFIISQDGYILTNHHVIDGAVSVSVMTYDGKQYDAAIIGSDSANDIALLKVKGSGMPAAILGSSDALHVGDQVVAIGNPLGELTSTMTVGYVSGKERAVTTDGATIDMIQTDAAINSGNSGGPLFNMRGEVVGITTAKYSGLSASGASIEGIGFAIPMDDVMEVVGDLMEYGYVKSAYLGVTVRDFDASVAAIYNLPAGVYVESVEAGGPADAAGVKPEDIIIALGATKVTNYNDLAGVLRTFEPGDETQITVYRGGQELTLEITLTERPKELSVPETEQPQGEMPSEGNYEDWYNFFAPFFGNGNSGD